MSTVVTIARTEINIVVVNNPSRVRTGVSAVREDAPQGLKDAAERAYRAALRTSGRMGSASGPDGRRVTVQIES